MIDLYYWTTPNGHKITMFLEETGMPYRIVPVNIGRGEQFKPEFLKIAPNNRIPAIVDTAPVDGESVSLFESGAILLYLAEKSKQLIPTDLRGRATTLEWLFWQVAGLGPMAGQTHHFLNYAPEKIQYAIDRYVKETSRLYAVLDKQLEGREFIAGAYSIADIACYPWVVPWNMQNQNMDEHPNLKRWLAAIKERPSTVRAYARAQEVNPTQKPMDDEAKKLLFGQDASTVRGKT